MILPEKKCIFLFYFFPQRSPIIVHYSNQYFRRSVQRAACLLFLGGSSRRSWSYGPGGNTPDSSSPVRFSRKDVLPVRSAERILFSRAHRVNAVVVRFSLKIPCDVLADRSRAFRVRQPSTNSRRRRRHRSRSRSRRHGLTAPGFSVFP